MLFGAPNDSLGAMSELVQVLIAARTEAGLSQDALAKAMGTSQSIVARFESGITDPRLTTLERYLKPLGRKLTIVRTEPKKKRKAKVV